jgi:hypothetical protein
MRSAISGVEKIFLPALRERGQGGAAGETGATGPIGPTGDGVTVVNQITGGTYNVTNTILDAVALAGEGI